MFELGNSLKEARTRRGVEFPQAEQATKIRAKYLRALENEEWDLLPGPTYVKSFLRTYAEALWLDSKALVEEYKLDDPEMAREMVEQCAEKRIAMQRDVESVHVELRRVRWVHDVTLP